MIARWATRPEHSRGRLYPEADRTARRPRDDGQRDAFQKDRDRIIHSISFRRLRHKTQVFMAPDGDHFRVRLTHSLEVAQIGRTIARALGVNEDLTEALCLAHDIGHPPFGHAGEAALKSALSTQGGFDHNGHTLRALMAIERPYPRWPGLNLCWETLEGLAKHNGPVTAPEWALAEADRAVPLDLQHWPGLEAQIAAIADDIAYDNHDIDDGLRAGLLSLEQVLSVPLVREIWDEVRPRFADVASERLAGELIRTQIGAMVGDLIATSRATIAAASVESAADVRAAGRALIVWSPEMQAAERALKRFMYAELYRHPHQLAAADIAHGIVTGLFQAYAHDPAQLPDDWRARLPDDEPWRSRHIADFIAGMTDRYAIGRYRALIGPIDLPDGF